MKSPATNRTTVMVFIQLSLETFIYVIDITYTCLNQNLTGFFGTISATADKDDRYIIAT
jgi:hypothetical protein